MGHPSGLNIFAGEIVDAVEAAFGFDRLERGSKIYYERSKVK